MNTSRRSPTPTRPLARLVVLAALLCAAFAPLPVRAQSHADQHVSAIVQRTLVSVSPVALVDPVRQRRARAITDYHQGMFAGWCLAPIVAFLWLWRSGNAARLRDLLRRRLREMWVVRATFGAALGAYAMLASLPFAFAEYRIDANVGLTFQPIPLWFAGEFARIVIAAAFGAIAIAVVLELVDRTRLWYLAFIALLYACTLVIVAIEPVLLSPLASHHRPAPAGVVAIGDRVAQRLGVMPVVVEIASDASHSGIIAARTSGLGPFTRIVLDNDALARVTPGETAYLLARQYAHVLRGDVLILALWGTTLFVIAGALAVLVSDRIGFRRDDDPLARLALVGTCLGITVLVLLPVYNGIARRLESRADRLAIAATHDPASAVRYFVRNANDGLIPLCGRRTTRWYFNARDPLGSRISAVTGRPDACPG